MAGIKGMRWDEDKKSDSETVWCRLSGDRLKEVDQIEKKFKLSKRSHVITMLVEYALDKLKGTK